MTPSGQHGNGMSEEDTRTEEALTWFVRTSDPNFVDWAAFTDWLEQDTENADSYHRIAASDAAVLPLLAKLELLQDNQLSAPADRRRSLRWTGGLALVASLAGVFSFQELRTEEFLTQPGEQRTVKLPGGNELILNGDTAVTLTGLSRRDVRVQRGQAYFRLRGKDKLNVTAGDIDLVDIGTEFEVSRDGRQTRVIVAEGAVLVDPDGAQLRLNSGQQLETFDGATRLRPSLAAAGAAGAWARGQLVYVDQAVSAVAADLRRSTGLAMKTNSAIGARRFTGTLNLADVRRDPSTLGPLLGVTMRRAGDGWVLGED